MIGATNGELHVEKNKVFGYQQIGSYETRVYLYLETDVVPLQTEEGNTVVMKFPENDKRINLRYGISFISVDQAKWLERIWKLLHEQVELFGMMLLERFR